MDAIKASCSDCSSRPSHAQCGLNYQSTTQAIILGGDKHLYGSFMCQLGWFKGCLDRWRGTMSGRLILESIDSDKTYCFQYGRYPLVSRVEWKDWGIFAFCHWWGILLLTPDISTPGSQALDSESYSRGPQAEVDTLLALLALRPLDSDWIVLWIPLFSSVETVPHGSPAPQYSHEWVAIINAFLCSSCSYIYLSLSLPIYLCIYLSI